MRLFRIAGVPGRTIHSTPVPPHLLRPDCLRRFVAKPERIASLAPLLLLSLALTGCHKRPFPEFPADYREFAYVSDGAAGTVTVLDLVNMREDRTLQVGRRPTGLAVNPKRSEVYVVNSGSDSVSVIDALENRVVYTMAVHRSPFSISVAPDGQRAYVADAGSNTVSVLDLAKRKELGVAGTGEGPGLARVSPDNRSVVVSNRVAGSVSIYDVDTATKTPLHLRSVFPGCPGATDVTILPDSSKAFIACSGGHQVMAVWLSAAPNSWRGKQDPMLQKDHLLALLDVGLTPTHLATKSDNGEVFSTNFDGNSISEISAWTNEVSNTYQGFMHPSQALISRDNSTLWVSDFGSDSVSLYSIDDGRIAASVRTGSHPDAMALSEDERLLLTADSGSADVSVIRTQASGGPTLFTQLPAGPQPNDVVIFASHQHGR